MIDVDLDDYDRPEFFSQSVHKARSKHHCCECLNSINPGEKYECASGKWDNRVDTYKTCLLCAEIREKLFSRWAYGELWETLKEEIRNGDPKLELDLLSPEAKAKLFHKFPKLDEKDDEDESVDV